MDKKSIWYVLNEMGRTDKTTREELSEMILKLAVIELHKSEIESIPSNDELSKMYSFSPKFELRMKKLIDSSFQ